MIKPWKIGTNIQSYINRYIEFTKDQTIEFIRVKHLKGTKELALVDYYDENKIIYQTSKATISQLLRTLIALKFIKPNHSSVSKDITVLWDKISYEVQRLNPGERIGDFIIAQNIDSLVERLRGENIFYPSETRFLFSLFSTLLSMHDKTLVKYINQKLESGSINSYSEYYLSTAKEITESVIDYKEKLIPLIQLEIVSFDEDTAKLVESIDSKAALATKEYYSPINLSNQIETHASTFGGFIKSNFATNSSIKVPIYQRIYRWPWSTVKTLLFDIDSIDNIKKYSHYVGNIIIRTNQLNMKMEHKLIDGQQRVTTLTIILRALYDISKYKKVKVDTLANTRLSGLSEESISKTFSRVDGNNDFDVFKSVIDGTETKKRSIIMDNYKNILNWMNVNLSSKEKIESFWNKLLNGVTLVTINDKASNEYKLFEKLNTGAVPLTTLELFKNYILDKFIEGQSLTEKQMQVLFQEKIISKLATTRKNPTNKEVNDYISTVIRSEDESVNDDTLFNQYKNFIETKYFDNNVEDSFKDVVNKISKNIEIYKWISDYKEFSKNSNPLYKIADFLLMLNGRAVYYPLIMKILKVHIKDIKNSTLEEVNKVRSLLRVIETFEVRMQITSYRGQSLSKKMEKITIEFNEATTPKELFKAFSGGAISTGISSIKDFENALSQQTISNKAASLVLFRIENYVHLSGWDMQKSVNFIALYDKKAQREHLLPQNWEETWANDLIAWTGKSLEEIKISVSETINMIGNAFPIPDWSNASVSDHKLETKINIYKKSIYAKQLISMQGNENIKPIGNKFTPDIIRERSKEIAKLATEIWQDIV